MVFFIFETGMMSVRLQGHSYLINYLIAFIIIISINFMLPRMMPGDPLTAIYGEEALISLTPEIQADLSHKLGLDKPLWAQFFLYLASLATLDFGHSYYYNAPVLNVIAGVLPWTLLLVGCALIVSTLLGIYLGIESGWRRGGRTDHFLLTVLMFLNGFPDFFIGILLLLAFSVTLGLLPLGGALTPFAGYTGLALVLDIARHMLLPFLALTLAHLSGSYLLTRNTMVTTLAMPFILTARAKGLDDRTIRYNHAGRNSMLPVITRTGVRFGILFTGVLFIEVVFAYPGIGLLLYNSLFTRDYTLLQGIFIIVSISVLLANFITDRLYKKIDPRIDHAY